MKNKMSLPEKIYATQTPMGVCTRMRKAHDDHPEQEYVRADLVEKLERSLAEIHQAYVDCGHYLPKRFDKLAIALRKNR